MCFCCFLILSQTCFRLNRALWYVRVSVTPGLMAKNNLTCSPLPCFSWVIIVSGHVSLCLKLFSCFLEARGESKSRAVPWRAGGEALKQGKKAREGMGCSQPWGAESQGRGDTCS